MLRSGGSALEEIARKTDELMGARQWEEAEALLLYSREAAARKGNRALELSLCSELMGFYRMRGCREGFFPVWERTLELLDEVRPAQPSRGTILINGATGLVAFGEAETALPYYQEAWGCYLRSLGADDLRFAALFNNMAAAFESRGAFDRAEEHIRMALSVLEKHPHHPDVATSYVNLAQLYARRDPADHRVGECLDAAMAALDDPETVWDGYYAHTARKCAGGFDDLGQRDRGNELRERADILYEGT